MKNRPKRTLAESNPGWMARMLRKLRTNSPAPTSATVAKATSPMTSTLRVRREAAPAVSLRLPSFRTSFKLERNTNSAGAIPEINAAVTQAKAVNSRMRPFKVPSEPGEPRSDPGDQSRRHPSRGGNPQNAAVQRRRRGDGQPDARRHGQQRPLHPQQHQQTCPRPGRG